MSFQFVTAGNIVFGVGTARGAGKLAAPLGRHALVVTGRDAARAGFLLDSLRQNNVGSTMFSVAGEPSINVVDEGVALAKRERCDLVIGVGGGSALDTGKAIAAMLTNKGPVLDYLEVIGGARPLTQPSAPFIAIPTTAGTGSEVTRNAVLASPKHRVKVSLRNALMLPRIAVVDPELTYDLPPAITASTGLDALTQVIEPYVSCRANPMTDALCVEGMKRGARSLRLAFRNDGNRTAREEMCVVSLFGGLALANAGLGAVHGFAGVIGGMFNAAHGAICAALLAHVMEANIRALRERQADGEALRRYDAVGVFLTGEATATADDGVKWVRQLVCDLKVPGLGKYGLQTRDADEVIEKAAKASSMKANPIVLTTEELRGALEGAIDG
ncbi:MAG TPA: iron-containing alcohol dehydrogenase [Verrucomicrobiae bacterium]|jgi:alcohol dehydrogenase class IV|nr:iron-containing alcohol dehydrogenase [Verrucomicrobiae bacterium]